MATIDAVISEAMGYAMDRYEVTGNPSLPDDYRQSVIAALAGIWEPSIVDEAKTVTGEFKDGFPQIETKEAPEFFRRIVEEFIAQFGALKVTQIVEATAEQMQRLILNGTKEGQSIAEIAKAIRENIPQIAALRAHVIVRTETHSASMYGGLAAAKQSRVPLKKVWKSVEDYRTRNFADEDQFSHRLMNGVAVDIDDVFLVPSKNGVKEPLAYPGDPSGSAGNIIMCRCAMTYRRVGSLSGL